MAIHFTKEEFDTRIRRTRERMAEQGLDGMLLFRQESMYYLTGYDTFGYVFFQCLYLGAGGEMFLLTRLPDLSQARETSTIEDIHIWPDGVDAQPARMLRDLLKERGCGGQRLGVEYEAYGMTGRTCLQLTEALEGFCRLEEASFLVSELRLVKSEAELAYVTRAAELADDALDEALRLAAPGADEGEILAAMQGAVFRGGGDYPGNPYIIGSGREALLVRYHSGRRRLDAQDQLTLEFAGAYRHYHACMMRTLVIGEPSPLQREMHAAAVSAMEACEAALKPGNTFGDVYRAHETALGEAGFGEARLFACGYSLGTTFAPNWMDWPMLYENNPVTLLPNMVIFLHMVIQDREHALAMMPGHTVVCTESGCRRLSRHNLELA